MSNRFLDGLGLAFDEAILPGRYASIKIVSNRKAQQEYRSEWDHCQLCGCRGDLDLHHIIGGARRSDERTNFLMVCHSGGCHDTIQNSPDWLAVALYARWWLDREYLSWQRLTDLKGLCLPKPKKVSAIIERYRLNQGF